MNKEQTIKKITIVTQEGVKSYQVGRDDVIGISDKSIEFPDSITFIFKVKGKNGVISEIINCPVEIEFF